MYLIDTHCHLDHYSSFDLKSAIENAEANRVKQIISVGTKQEDWLIYRAMHLAYKERIVYTVGLHPSYVSEDSLKSIETLSSFFEGDHPPIALGECGLDYYHLDPDPETAKVQKLCQQQAFEEQLALAKKDNYPIIIHCRKAFRHCVDLIVASQVAPQRVIFHCFSEGLEAMQELLSRGYRASFTGILTYKNAAEVRECARLQGLDQLILETDAPWLAPVPKRGEANQPAYLLHIAEYAAKLFDVSLDTLISITTQNAQNFFRLPSLE